MVYWLATLAMGSRRAVTGTHTWVPRPSVIRSKLEAVSTVMELRAGSMWRAILDWGRSGASDVVRARPSVRFALAWMSWEMIWSGGPFDRVLPLP